MMNERTFRYELRPEQMNCLQEAAALNNEILNGVTIVDLVIEGTGSEIELIREQLTTLLAKTGFDENYELTTKGELIEGLIDLLYER